MNRGVNEEGLKLHKQLELPLIMSAIAQQQLPQPYFLSLLAQASTSKPSNSVLGPECLRYPERRILGRGQEFYADSQLDNLASCHAGSSALLDETVLQADSTLVCAFFDHEEIGSESKKAPTAVSAGCVQRIAISARPGRLSAGAGAELHDQRRHGARLSAQFPPCLRSRS